MLNNEVSAIDLCKQKAIIDHFIELANQWLPEVATHTLVLCECEAFTYSLGITPFWRKLPLEGVILSQVLYQATNSWTKWTWSDWEIFFSHNQVAVFLLKFENVNNDHQSL